MDAFLAANRGTLFENYERRPDKALGELGELAKEHLSQFIEQLIAVFGTLDHDNHVEEPPEQLLQDIDARAQILGIKAKAQGADAKCLAHHFGDICELITELAIEQSVTFEVVDYQILNKCLDSGIGGAISGYNFGHRGIEHDGIEEEYGAMMHELRNLISAAHLAFSLIQRGKVGLNGSTGNVLARSLASLRSLVERSLVKIKEEKGQPVSAVRSHMLISAFVEELSQTVVTMYGKDRFIVRAEFPPGLYIFADKELLMSAVFNLIHNGFKYTCPGTSVAMAIEEGNNSLRISVSDHCGGIKGKVEDIFKSYVQTAEDRSGLGLGLTIVRKNIEAHGGDLTVENHPGIGCTFIVELPLVNQAGVNPDTAL